MSVWDSYPSTYRAVEVNFLLSTVQAGNCAWVVGLSGSGKSNLAGFFVHRAKSGPNKILVDCNRLSDPGLSAFYRLINHSLEEDNTSSDDPFLSLERKINDRIETSSSGLCLVIDRFENLPVDQLKTIGANLRALRDDHKYELSFIITSRQPPPPDNEMAELFLGHTLWLGPLSNEDALWSVEQYAARTGQNWNIQQKQVLLQVSAGYASLLRAACEAAAKGCPMNPEALTSHPAVRQRVDEFLTTHPTQEDLQLSAIKGHPLLDPVESQDPSDLTAGEARLLDYLKTHPQQICEKDDLIKAVWPEDKVYLVGIRDDSLAQLVRRLRLKIEQDPSNPQHIQTIPGRGYRYKA